VAFNDRARFDAPALAVSTAIVRTSGPAPPIWVPSQTTRSLPAPPMWHGVWASERSSSVTPVSPPPTAPPQDGSLRSIGP